MVDEFNTSNPIYLQIAERVNRQVVKGELKAGDKLPSVREMAMTTGVNPNTIQRTYSELERLNIVETKRGQGTFITENEDILSKLRTELKSKQITSFVRDMKEMGFSDMEIIDGIKQFLGRIEEGDMKND